MMLGKEWYHPKNIAISVACDMHLRRGGSHFVIVKVAQLVLLHISICDSVMPTPCSNVNNERPSKTRYVVGTFA